MYPLHCGVLVLLRGCAFTTTVDMELHEPANSPMVSECSRFCNAIYRRPTTQFRIYSHCPPQRLVQACCGLLTVRQQ